MAPAVGGKPAFDGVMTQWPKRASCGFSEATKPEFQSGLRDVPRCLEAKMVILPLMIWNKFESNHTCHIQKIIEIIQTNEFPFSCGAK
jgi:hypothetical protein